MATYIATISIPALATFVNDSEVGFLSISANAYVTQYSALTGSTPTEFLETAMLLLLYNIGVAGTYTVTNVSNIYTITLEVATEIDFTNAPSWGNLIAFRSDTDGLGARYANFGFLELQEPCETTIVCPTCYEINKSACEDSYTFVAGLTPSTVYYVVIENNRNKQYVQQVTTDGSGDFSIDATAPEFPIGFFIPEQFKYTLKVYSNSTLMNQEDITIGSTIYTCITLGFVNTVTTTASANFGVDFLIDDELNYIVDDLGNTFSV